MPIAWRATCWPPAPRRRRPSTRGSATSCGARDGELDRAALGRIVFGDPAALRDLEAIVHPAVRPRILAEVDAADAAGAVAVVDRGDQARRGRARRPVRRGVAGDLRARRAAGAPGRCAAAAPDDARDRIAAQGDLATRLRPAATHVIDTGDAPDDDPRLGSSSGSTRPWLAPESSDRPGHTRRPGRSGGAPGQRRGDGGVREEARETGLGDVSGVAVGVGPGVAIGVGAGGRERPLERRVHDRDRQPVADDHLVGRRPEAATHRPGACPRRAAGRS